MDAVHSPAMKRRRTKVAADSPDAPSPDSSASFNVLAAKATCFNCSKECERQKMCPWSSTSMTCHVCKTNYNRKMEHIRGKKDELKWFKGVLKDKVERTNWFERQKGTYEPCKRSAFDEPGKYVEASGSTDFDKNYADYRWLPIDEWGIRQRALGECGEGTAKEQADIAREDFKEKVADPRFPTRCVRGTYLLGVYKGEAHEVGSEDFMRQESKLYTHTQKTKLKCNT